MPCGARPRSRIRAMPGWASRSTLLTMAPATVTPCARESDALSTISSIGRPTPPSLTMIAGAPSIAATVAFDRPTTAPTPAWPVPSMSRMSWSAKAAWAARIRAPQVLHDLARDVRLGEAARDVDRAHHA